MNLSRRSLFGIGAAFVAAPAIVRVSALMPISAKPLIMSPTDALVASMIETKEVTAARVLNLAQIRNLLLPGLRNLEDRYMWVPAQYDKIFGAAT